MLVGAPETAQAFRVEPYSYSEARALVDALGVSEPVAITLVRRGYRTIDAARDFLEARESHDPFEFSGMEEVTGRLLDAVRAGRGITVHGDYDVDGVCATAILVGTLGELGARCDWLIPDRLGDGYGLTSSTVERLAARGTEVLLTADCGITSADEIAAAREAGIEAIVTDHHAPGPRLPECPVLHPRLSGYPCSELCATGVAYKLAVALRERAGLNPNADADLDLVALATVADLVSLTGENRALVRRGLAEIRRARRPGIRALMAAAGVEPSRLDEGDLAFRLAPRINAAGRLYRADAGVELLLTSDDERAAQIAAELDRANRERRRAETEVLRGAGAALDALPGEPAAAPALVLAGEGWHPGVVGIVASRLVERHWRPVVLIGLDGRGRGRGSGRSIPGFDLVAALGECGEHLLRFGGHSAAAGLEIEASRVEAFREAFIARAAEALDPDDLVRTETVDAVVGGDRLGLEMAEELERLAPFGIGNPGVRLLIPSARVRDIRPMGENGKHARFSLESGPARALGVAFGAKGELSTVAERPVDVTVRLEINHWNSAVEPRVVLGDIYPLGTEAGRGEGGEEAGPGGCAACPDRALGAEWWRRLDAERTAPLDEWPPRTLASAAEGTRERDIVERAGGSGVAAVAELVSSGEPVLALCADVSRRRLLAEQAADPSRFGAGRPVFACGRCAEAAVRRRTCELLAAGSGLGLADWGALARDPRLPGRFQHVVVIDPPPFAHLEAVAAAGREAAGADGSAGPGYLHLAWGEAELRFAVRIHEAEWELRPALAALYRELRERGGAARGGPLLDLLAGDGPHPRTPEHAGRCVRVLEELALLKWEKLPGRRAEGTESQIARRLAGQAAKPPQVISDDPVLRVLSSEETNLELSAAFVAYRSRYEEGRRFLSSRQRAHR